MKKRILSLLLASSVMVSFAGCSSSSGSNKTASSPIPGGENAIDFKEAPYTINISYPVFGAAQPDLQKVFDKVNEITLKKINAKVELKVVTVANMANTYSLAAASGEKSDLIGIVPGFSYMPQFAGSKMIKPFDEELDKWGKDIKAGLGDQLEAGKYQGKLYAMVNKQPAFNGTGFWLLKSIVDKYNIDTTKIKTLNDLDPVFEKVKAGEPDMQIYWPGGSYYLTNFDDLGNSYGVLKNGGTTDLKLVNPYETDEWLSMVKKMREWYLKGYIPKDYATAQTQPSSLQNANKLFALNNVIGFDNQVLGENPAKVPVLTYAPVKKTKDLQNVMWAIPASCQRPDKVIQLLNLAYQDKDLAKLTKFGIEGEHYDVMPDGSIDANKGIKTFRQGWNMFGDTNLLPINKAMLVGLGGDAAKYNSTMTEWNKNTKSSKALGFMFDQTPVKTELAGLDAVSKQYGTLIEGGGVDPDKEIKNFTDKLNAAGFKKVMDEKQKQLDEWAKAKGVK